MNREVSVTGLLALLCCAAAGGCHLLLDELPRATTTADGGGTVTTTGGGDGSSTTSSEGGGGSATTISSEGGGGSATTTSSEGGGGSATTTSTSICMGGCELGESCSAPADCKSGFCADSICCDSLCNAACFACSTFKKGGGTNGICEPVSAGAEPDSDCPAAEEACDGQGGCKLDKGQGCVDGTQCASGHCAEGLCCDTACDSLCEACALPDTPGICTKVPLGSDPSGECNGGGPADNCNGAGSCGVGPQGTPCLAGMDAACESGSCVDGYCCENACTGQVCLACRSDYTGMPNGTCVAIVGKDPEEECPGDTICVGNNQCGM